MPTNRKRHSITETPRVEAALDELRRVTPGERVDLGELVILGARSKLDRLRAADERRDELLDDLAARVLAGDVGVDPAAADEVRRLGWARP